MLRAILGDKAMGRGEREREERERERERERDFIRNHPHTAL